MDQKPGYKTTEFWLALGSIALAQFGPLAAAAGPKTAAVVAAASATIYNFGRAWEKATKKQSRGGTNQ